VDDDASVRRSLMRLLSACGHEVETFPSGDDYLRRRPATPPGCLILDVRMPGRDGLEVQAALEAESAAPPVIILTAHDSPRARVRAEAAAVLAFLTKPVDAADLLAAVSRCLTET